MPVLNPAGCTSMSLHSLITTVHARTICGSSPSLKGFLQPILVVNRLNAALPSLSATSTGLC